MKNENQIEIAIVLKNLKKRAKNGIRTIELAKKCGIIPQTLRGRINELRCFGFPVCVSEYGYYLENDKEKVLNYTKKLELKAKGIMRAVRGLRKFKK